jgi:hypothetical protein
VTLGEFSIVVSIVGSLPYVWQVVHGRVRPERITWLIWTIIMTLALLGYQAAGAGDSIWFIVGDLIVTTTIFLLSLWHGAGGYGRLDMACLGIAIFGLIIWQTSSLPVFVIFGVLLADVMALIPTVVKTLRDPLSESASTFLAGTIAALMGVVAVGEWNLMLLFYPFYLFLANFVLAMVILVGQHEVKRLAGTHDG